MASFCRARVLYPTLQPAVHRSFTPRCKSTTSLSSKIARLAIPTQAGLPGPRPAELALRPKSSSELGGFQFDALIQNSKQFRYTPEEDRILMEAVMEVGEDFARIREDYLPHRTTSSINGRWLRLTPQYRRGKWTADEIEQLRKLYKKFGKKWTLISKEHMPWRSPLQMASLFRSKIAANTSLKRLKGTLVNLSEEKPKKYGRGQKSKRPWTLEENEILQANIEKLGYRWTLIVLDLPGRSPEDAFHQYWRRLYKDPELTQGTEFQEDARNELWTAEEDAKLTKAMNELWESPSVWLDIRKQHLPHRCIVDIRCRWRRITDPKILPVPLIPYEKKSLEEAVKIFGIDFRRIA
ncbi:Myblike DNAbinding domain-containing protein, partial [Dinochytrium kinnereticum]